MDYIIVARAQDSDIDGDGIKDKNDSDDDNDGIPDSWENQYGLNPLGSADAAEDTDGDGLSNLQEYNSGTDPTSQDTDGDGVNDNADPDPLDPDVNTSVLLKPLSYPTSPVCVGQPVTLTYGMDNTREVNEMDAWLNFTPTDPITLDSNVSGQSLVSGATVMTEFASLGSLVVFRAIRPSTVSPPPLVPAIPVGSTDLFTVTFTPVAADTITFDINAEQSWSRKLVEIDNLGLYEPEPPDHMSQASEALQLTIVDCSLFQFSTTGYTITETAGSATITVTRTGDTSGAASVDYTTESAENTATAGSDYTAATGTLNWAAGETEATFTVSITDDSSKETPELIYLSFSNPVGGDLGEPATATLTIQDNDATAGALQFAAPSYSFAESAGTVALSVLRTGGTDFAVSVDYASTDGSAVASEDYSAVSGTLSWEAGDSTSQSINLTLLDDIAIEGNEDLMLTLSNPTGGAFLGANTPVTVSINDDEGAGTVAFDRGLYRFDENVASGVATLRVQRLGGNAGAVSVDYAASEGTAVDGADFNIISGVLNWLNSESTDRFIQVPLADDYLVEANENFYVALGNPTGGLSLGNIDTAQVLLVEDMGDSGSTAVGDINNDGSVDILFRHNVTGANKVWLMNCGAFSSETTLPTVNRDWRAVGIADFDNDGNQDIVLRHHIDDRHLVWFMNGDLTRRLTAFLPSVNYTWESQSMGDFNLDGRPDVVRRNTQTGTNNIWLMGGGGLGAARIGVGPLGAETDLNWRIVGSGDFNADGKADLMWRNTLTGANRVWLMNRFTYLSTSALPSQALQWKVAGVADFTCDGKPDILWRNQITGQTILWVMNGVTRSGAVELPTLDTVW